MLHVTCSSRRMGLEGVMLNLAKARTEEVIVPEHIQCCSWAVIKALPPEGMRRQCIHLLLGNEQLHSRIQQQPNP